MLELSPESSRRHQVRENMHRPICFAGVKLVVHDCAALTMQARILSYCGREILKKKKKTQSEHYGNFLSCPPELYGPFRELCWQCLVSVTDSCMGRLDGGLDLAHEFVYWLKTHLGIFLSQFRLKLMGGRHQNGAFHKKWQYSGDSIVLGSGTLPYYYYRYRFDIDGG